MIVALSPPEASVVILLAKWALAGPALLVLYDIVCRREWRRDIIAGTVGGIATVALTKISGTLYFHARPFVTFHVAPLITHVADNAFLSDHLAACGLAVGFLWTRSRVLAIAALTFALALGAARVLARLHWPVDILGGFAEGLIGSAVGYFIEMRLPQAMSRSKRP